MQKKRKKRYKTHPKYKGIRVETKTGRLLVNFSYKGKRYAKQFPADSIAQAIMWIEDVKGQKCIPIKGELKDLFIQTDFSGTTFEDVFERYLKEHVSTLGFRTQQDRYTSKEFFRPLFPVLMNNLKPQVIAKHILNQKEIALIKNNHRRYSFDNELKVLKAICNWWREEDYTFHNPILKKHFRLGRIKERQVKNKKMTVEEIKLFFEAMSARPFWNDFAIVHFFMAARVGEVAGLQKENLDFYNRNILVRDVCVWDKKSKQFVELKNCTKNGEDRLVYMNNIVAEILERKIEDSESSFVFHLDGRPLSYRQIQNNYDWALRRAGLRERYSGTHFMRHSMATITRLATGSLDAVQAVTGHKDQKLVQHYAGLDSSKNKNAQIEVLKLMGI